MAVTHGCIRMYPEDVAALFPLVPVGTKVWLINDPVKVTYVAGDLLMEAHPPVDSEGQSIEPDLGVLSRQLDRALGRNTVAIHWDFARQALQTATGMPTVVGLEADVDPAPVRASANTTTTPSPQPVAE
jgi:L,D-transpeptidase ErfK/SrfK